MGNDLKRTILLQIGIVTDDGALKAKPSILVCDRCKIVYSLEDKYCSSCSYPLTPQAYEEIKTHEDKKLQEMALVIIR
jgi:ribosomal protein L37E